MSDERPEAVERRSDDRPALTVPHPWLALVGTMIGMSMIIIDGSLVNVLLPDMITDLDLTQTNTQWVNSIYSLVFASLLIILGLMADRYGRRLLFLIGTAVFLLGSLGSGSAQDANVLIAARAVQATGAAMMLPSSIAVINVMFSGKQRAAAFGVWGAVFGGAAALGPLLGGWMAQDFSWRWAFLINIPVGVVAVIMVLRLVPETKGPRQGSIDIVGAILSALGLALIVFGLIEGQKYGWWISIDEFDLGPIHLDVGGLSVVPLAILLGIVLLGLLAAWEVHRSRSGLSSLIEISLFAIPRYRYGNLVALIVALGEFGILFALPLWMQSVHALDPLTIGAILSFLAVGALIAGGSARKVAARWGATDVVRMGMVLEIIGVLAIAATVSVERSPWWLVPPLIVYGLGVGFDSAQLTNVVLADVPPSRSGQAGAMTSTFRQVGSALGAAILGAVLFSGLGTILDNELSEENGISAKQRTEFVNEVQTSAGQAIVLLDHQSQQNPALVPVVLDSKDAYTKATRITATVAALFVAAGLIFSFGLPRDRPGGKIGPEPTDRDREPVSG